MSMQKYKNLKEKFEAYFEMCDLLNAEQKKIVKPYTLSGLIDSAGLTRAEFEKLQGNSKYRDTVNAAKAKVEAFIEENALTGGLSSNAAANSLKYNFGWGEKQNAAEQIPQGSKTIVICLEDDAAALAE